MKRACALAAMLAAALALLVPAWCAYAETRDAQVVYEVSATVIYVDGETETVQKAPVGSSLKAPEPKGCAGQSFVGWRNKETGAFWDFSAPVEGNLMLVAQYEAVFPGGEGASGALPEPGAYVASPLQLNAANVQPAKPHSSVKAGDVLAPLAALILLASVFAAGLACAARRFR